MDKFHEFVLEWSPDKIEFFTNGIKVCKITDKKIVDYFKSEQWIVINHGIQKEIGIKDKEYSSKFLVDYIRVYKKIN